MRAVRFGLAITAMLILTGCYSYYKVGDNYYRGSGDEELSILEQDGTWGPGEPLDDNITRVENVITEEQAFAEEDRRQAAYLARLTGRTVGAGAAQESSILLPGGGADADRGADGAD